MIELKARTLADALGGEAVNPTPQTWAVSLTRADECRVLIEESGGQVWLDTGDVRQFRWRKWGSTEAWANKLARILGGKSSGSEAFYERPDGGWVMISYYSVVTFKDRKNLDRCLADMRSDGTEEHCWNRTDTGPVIAPCSK